MRKHCGTGDCSHFDELPKRREVYVENDVSLLVKSKSKNSVKLLTDTDKGDGVIIEGDEFLNVKLNGNKIQLSDSSSTWQSVDNISADEYNVRFFITREDKIIKCRPGGLYFSKSEGKLYYGDENWKPVLVKSHVHMNEEVLDSLGTDPLPPGITLKQWYDDYDDRIKYISNELAKKQKVLSPMLEGGIILDDKGDVVEIGVDKITDDMIDEITNN